MRIVPFIFLIANRSSINPTDLLSIYEYLTDSLFPQSSQNELRGGSLSRSTSRSIDLSSQHGSFVTGPLALSDDFKATPKVYIFNENVCEVFQIIVYTAFGASLCLFVQGKAALLIQLLVLLQNKFSPQIQLQTQSILPRSIVIVYTILLVQICPTLHRRYMNRLMLTHPPTKCKMIRQMRPPNICF